MAEPTGRRESESRTEDLAALGRMLRDLRTGQGYSLEEVERATRVRAPFLRGIEEGCYEGLPGMVYARGFVRTYCEYLHAPDLWGRFDRLLHDSGGGALPPSGALGEYTPPRKVFRRSSRLWIYLILLGALGTAGYLIWQQRLEVRSTLDQAAIRQPDVTPSPLPPSPTPVAAAGGAILSGDGSPVPLSGEPRSGDAPVDLSWMDPASGDGLRPGGPRVSPEILSVDRVAGVPLTLEARRVCWVKVTEKGKVLFEGLLQPGETRTFQSSEVLRVRLGNGGITALKTPNQVLDPAGPAGKPLTLYLLPDGTLQKKRPRP